MSGDSPARPSTGRARILALSVEPVGDPERRPTRNSGFFAALDRRFDVVGTVRPVLPRWEVHARRLRHFYPTRDGWRARAGLNERSFMRRSAVAGEELRLWDGHYDLIMELQTLFAPGVRFRDRLYTVYTDNIYTLTERYFPAWAPLSRRERRSWRRLEQETCQSARFVFAMSDFLRNAIIEDYGCDPERVVRIGAGVNSAAASLDSKDYTSQVVLFVGIRFKPKGGATLLRAWDLVRRRVPGAELWIVGPRRLRVGRRPGVRCFGYVADREALAGLYERASILALPSFYDAFPHVLGEAMGHGLACVGTDRGGIPEIIEDGVTGMIVPAGEPEPLADALIALLEEPRRAESMGRRAHARVLAERTWDHVVARAAPCIEEAVAAPSGP